MQALQRCAEVWRAQLVYGAWEARVNMRWKAGTYSDTYGNRRILLKILFQDDWMAAISTSQLRDGWWPHEVASILDRLQDNEVATS